MTQLTAREEWKRSWGVVLASGIGFSFMSLMSPATGLFMAPLQQEFGWSRAFLSAGTLIGLPIGLLLSPVFGALIDRFGSRKLAIFGVTATSLSIASFATLYGSQVQWIVLWCVFALAAMTIHATTWSAAVAGVFDAGRGLALGVTLSGSALSSAIVPPLVNWLIADYGWRAAFIWVGLGWGGLALLLCIVFLYDVHDYRRDAIKADQTPLTARSDLPGLSTREAWRSSSLWRVAIATLLILTITVGTTVHLVPIIVSTGISRTNAAWLASLAGVAGIVGKVVTGILVDRFPVRWAGGLTLASTAIAYPLLLEQVRTTPLIITAIVIIGYGAGTKLQLCGFLTAKYGGIRNFGTIFGFMSSMIVIAGAAGPVLAGYAHDMTGDYTPFLIAGTIISVISGALVFSLGKYPDWPEASSRPAVGGPIPAVA